MENQKIVLNEVSPAYGFWEVTVEKLSADEKNPNKVKKVKEVCLIDAFTVKDVEEKVDADYGSYLLKEDYKITSIKKSKISIVY